METRDLRKQEKDLINKLLILSGSALPIPQTAIELDDGGMGTIRFHVDKRIDGRYGRDVIQVLYIDSDNVTVVITLTEDNNGDLFELEFWKTDFTPLKKYPAPEDIVISMV